MNKDAQPNGMHGAAPEVAPSAVEAAVRQAVRDAVLQHQRLGLPMVDWQDGAVVWVPADQLPVDQPSAN